LLSHNMFNSIFETYISETNFRDTPTRTNATRPTANRPCLECGLFQDNPDRPSARGAPRRSASPAQHRFHPVEDVYAEQLD
jgi:hypothetical protein